MKRSENTTVTPVIKSFEQRIATRLLAATLAASIAFPATAQAPMPTPISTGAPVAPAGAANAQDMEPKFIWGIVINIAFKLAMGVFSAWATNKLSNNLTNPDNMNRLLGNSFTAVIIPLAQLAFGFKSAGALENVVAKDPTTPLKVENGKENFQGVHVALVGFDRQGGVLGIQPVTAGFKTGDRIKLKLLPTFDGILVIENINPKGERKQIYPAQSSNVVSLKNGVEVLVPLGRDEYFEFAGATGDDQLVITYRDPRSFSAPATAAANRKDDATGSSFVQELTPNTYPVISQSLKLRHGS